MSTLNKIQETIEQLFEEAETFDHYNYRINVCGSDDEYEYMSLCEYDLKYNKTEKKLIKLMKRYLKEKNNVRY